MIDHYKSKYIKMIIIVMILLEIVYNIFEIQALSGSHSPNVFSCINDLLNSYILLKHNQKIDY